MKGTLVVDANLTVLLVVGSASRHYIRKHKRLREYADEDFELLGLIISEFSELVFLPHILAEASNLARQIEPDAQRKIQEAFRRLIEASTEASVESLHGARREEFVRLGLTDAVILHFCAMDIAGISPTLLTCDTELANIARASGYSVIDYRSEFLAR